MRLCVFGASGRTGSALVRQALERGHTVTAFCRTDSCRSAFPLEVKRVWGDLYKRSDVDRAIRDADAVVCLYGQRPPGTHIFCADVTAMIIESMKTFGVKRLLCVTGAMIGNHPLRRSLFIRLMKWLFQKHQPAVAEDRAMQEELIGKCGLDWTIIKPPRLTEGKKKGRYRAGEGLKVGAFSRISRQDLSAFILDQLVSDEYAGKRVVVEY